MDKNNSQTLTWQLLNHIIEESDRHGPIIEINVNTLIPLIKDTINQNNEEKNEQDKTNNICNNW